MDAKRPCVLYSGGHDSQVLLWLARQARPDVTAVYCEMHEDARKQAFVSESCHMWGIRLDVRRPFARDLIGNGDHIEVFNAFPLGESVLRMGMQATGRETNARHLCAVRLRCEDLPPRESWDYDLALMGQRDDDTDPAYGPVPVGLDELTVGGVRVLFPIRQWTNADVWTVTRQYGIPQNWRRYDKATGEKLTNSTWDNDRYHLCTTCLEPGQDVDLVECPRNGKAIYLGDLIDLESRRLAYWNAALNVRSENGAGIRSVGSTAG